MHDTGMDSDRTFGGGDLPRIGAVAGAISNPAHAPDLLDRAGIGRLAAEAVGRIRLWGRRGVTGVSAEQIEAMALELVFRGLVPADPDRGCAALPIDAPARPLRGPADGA